MDVDYSYNAVKEGVRSNALRNCCKIKVSVNLTQPVV